MAVYKAPDFNERTATARAARQRALDKMRDKPEPDTATVAARETARIAREAAAAERSAARKAAIEEEKAARIAAAAAKAAAAAEAAAAANKPKKTEAELKAARDARYAARKGRKG